MQISMNIVSGPKINN